MVTCTFTRRISNNELMAQHYRDIIIQVLKQFDNTQTSEIYNALAWRCLISDGEVDNLTGLTSNPTVAWKNVPQNERLQIISIVNNFINTNTPCQ